MKLITNFLSKLFSLTLTYKFFSFIHALYVYAKDYEKIGDVFYGEAFRTMMKQYLYLNLKKDWIGRLYGVINPNLDINGKFDVNNIVIEINDDQTNNNEYILNFIAKQLKLLDSLFHTNNLYSYISFDLKHIGPAIADNYLVVFDIASRQIMAQKFKSFMGQLLFYAGIGAILLYTVFNGII